MNNTIDNMTVQDLVSYLSQFQPDQGIRFVFEDPNGQYHNFNLTKNEGNEPVGGIEACVDNGGQELVFFASEY